MLFKDHIFMKYNREYPIRTDVVFNQISFKLITLSHSVNSLSYSFKGL